MAANPAAHRSVTFVGRMKPCPSCKAAMAAHVGLSRETGASFLWWRCPVCGRAENAVELPAALAEQVWR